MGPKKILATLLLAAAVICFVVAAIKIFWENKNAPNATLRIDSIPRTTVFLNDQKTGQTPHLAEGLPPGEYKVKLIASGETGTFVNWEGKVALFDGTLTYVSRSLARDADQSSGQILTLEKLPTLDAHDVAVVSDPDSAAVFVDGQKEGKTSVILKDVAVGDHEISISLPGYSDEVVHAKVTPGYRLNIVVKLAKRLETAPSVRPTAQLVATGGGETKPYVVIKETGTGFLRVRAAPNITASESARVKPGEKYPLLLQEPGWVKIQLPNLSGWVAGEFVEVVK